MLSDQDYIEAANKGDPAGFDGLYHRYRDWVYSLAWRFTGDHADALDVLQDTFIYLLRKFPHFTLQAKMTTFLYPVVKHLALRLRRKKQRCPANDDLLAALPNPVSPTPPSSRRKELANLLKHLPPKQQEVLLLRFVDDLALEEIAAALAIPLGTVKSRLHTALATLRQSPHVRKYFRE